MSKPPRIGAAREARPLDEYDIERLLPLLNATTAALVTFIRRIRAHRNANFPEEIFGEPAWDILLDLYAAELRQQRVQTSAVAVGAGCAPTTAQRYIHLLETKGLIHRTPDPGDRRRIYVSLTEMARRRLVALFAIMQDEMSLVQPR